MKRPLIIHATLIERAVIVKCASCICTFAFVPRELSDPRPVIPKDWLCDLCTSLKREPRDKGYEHGERRFTWTYVPEVES